jgi:hypothetical protein
MREILRPRQSLGLQDDIRGGPSSTETARQTEQGPQEPQDRAQEAAGDSAPEQGAKSKEQQGWVAVLVTLTAAARVEITRKLPSPGLVLCSRPASRT